MVEIFKYTNMHFIPDLMRSIPEVHAIEYYVLTNEGNKSRSIILIRCERTMMKPTNQNKS